jgi:hypothetical protein
MLFPGFVGVGVAVGQLFAVRPCNSRSGRFNDRLGSISGAAWLPFKLSQGGFLSCRREALLSCYSAAMLYFRSSNKIRVIYSFSSRKKNVCVRRGV